MRSKTIVLTQGALADRVRRAVETALRKSANKFPFRFNREEFKLQGEAIRRDGFRLGQYDLRATHVVLTLPEYNLKLGDARREGQMAGRTAGVKEAIETVNALIAKAVERELPDQTAMPGLALLADRLLRKAREGGLEKPEAGVALDFTALVLDLVVQHGEAGASTAEAAKAT